jgi:hypothetical protein
MKVKYLICSRVECGTFIFMKHGIFIGGDNPGKSSRNFFNKRVIVITLLFTRNVVQKVGQHMHRTKEKESEIPTESMSLSNICTWNLCNFIIFQCKSTCRRETSNICIDLLNDYKVTIVNILPKERQTRNQMLQSIHNHISDVENIIIQFPFK